MSPVLKVALSHSGVVNTIPHAIVYAPLGFHGLNVPDLYVEQGVSKIIRLIKYGRKSKHITSCLIRHNCEAMKIELGCNGYLFQHAVKLREIMVTPSWLKFTWRFLKEKDIQITDDIPDFPLRRERDRLLMEVFGSQGWPDKTMYKINVCRLYLHVITISDITDGCGKLLSKNAVSGVRDDQKSAYRWPVQPRPPESFWVEWRKALESLCGRANNLVTPLGKWTSDGIQSASWFYDQHTESLYHKGHKSITFPYKRNRPTRHAVMRFDASRPCESSIPVGAVPCKVIRQGDVWLLQGFSEIIPTGASVLREQSFQQQVLNRKDMAWAFENLLCQGSMQDIANDICAGTVTCVADGSFKDQHGTAAWKIVNMDHQDNSIAGQCVAPGLPDQQNAYRSELSGLYAGIAMINELVRFFDIQTGSVTLACDNLAAITITSYQPNGVNPTSCAHFDLVMAIQDLKSTQINWNHVHVAGHQDSLKDHVLSPIERLNVEMDLQAKAHWERTKNRSLQDRLHHFVGEPWSLSVASEKIVNNMGSRIANWCQRPRIHGYWEEKQRFQNDDLQNIDYSIAEAAMKSVNAEKRRWIVKHSSGFCGVNKWRKRWKQIETEKCPRCEHPVEDITHVWKCKGKESAQKWNETLTSLRKELTALRTARLLPISSSVDLLLGKQTQHRQIFHYFLKCILKLLRNKTNKGGKISLWDCHRLAGMNYNRYTTPELG